MIRQNGTEAYRDSRGKYQFQEMDARLESKQGIKWSSNVLRRDEDRRESESCDSSKALW